MWWSASSTEPDKFEDRLYITDASGASNKQALKRLQITHVLSAVGFEPPFPQDFKYLVLHVDDADEEDMVSHFPSCVQFIREALNSGGAVVIHCAAGISRSSTVAICYLMTTKGINFEEALDIVKKGRSCVYPNWGFRRQLKLWQRMNYSLTGDSPAHKQYRTLKLLWQRKKAFRRSLWMFQDPNDDAAFSSKPQSYKCASCKRRLFHPDNIILHERSLKSFGGVPVSATDDCDSWFIQPCGWMSGVFTSDNSKGDLHCPSCDTVVGGWSWDEVTCGCGEPVAPAFRIPKSTVIFDDPDTLKDAPAPQPSAVSDPSVRDSAPPQSAI